MSAGSVSNQDAIREAGGIQPLIALLAGAIHSEGMVAGARCLANLSRDNATNRYAICEQQGIISRLVTLLSYGAAFEGARQASEVLCCLMLGQQNRIAISMLSVMRRQSVGLGENSSFALSSEFPELLYGLSKVVSNRLATAVNRAATEGSLS